MGRFNEQMLTGTQAGMITVGAFIGMLALALALAVMIIL